MSDKTLVEQAIADEGVLAGLLADLRPENKNKTRRYESFLTLQEVCEKRPELLYGRWDFLASLLRSDNTNAKYCALHLFAPLADVDREDRFEELFDAYFCLLDDDKTSVAAHIAGCAGRIARAKPGLRSKITERLLGICRESGEHKRADLIAGYAIESFSAYFDESEDQEKMLGFARAYLQCDSPKTKKIARQFLDNHRG